MNTHRFFGDYQNACNLHMVVNSTGERGGDAGHGGETSIELSHDGSMSLDVQTDEASNAILLTARGDAELRNLAAALRDAADFLELVLRK